MRKLGGGLLKRVLVATSNPGKIRDLIGAAAAHSVQIEMLPGFSLLPSVVEDGATFEANARKKAEFYSKHAEGEIVIADDSGLEVDALGCAPGVRSARYAADEHNLDDESGNSDDEANNARLLRELHDLAPAAKLLLLSMHDEPTVVAAAVAAGADGLVLKGAIGRDLMPAIDALLIASGPLTAFCLFLFAYGARRIPYSTLGLLQYIAPSLQLACGVFAFHEPFERTHVAGFALIWTALVIYAGDGLWRAR